MTYCEVLLIISLCISLGMAIWLGRTYMALLDARLGLERWREKAVTAEVLRSRDAYVKAVDTEALRPRDHSNE